MKRVFTLLAALLLTCGFSWAQTRTQVTDHMTAEDLAATGTTYTDFSNVTLNSDAVYAGQSAKNNAGAIQLRSKNSNSGIITTASGGTISSITITVESGTNTIDVYGKNTAYTSASDLYATSGSQNNQGTKIASLTETTTITVTDDYAYVGIRSNNGAVYIASIDFVWETGGSANDPSITADNVEIAYNATSGSISYTLNNPATNGQMTATTNADWLTPGTASGSPVAFTCTANTTSVARTATVTLTYTYNTDQTTTKNVQVTQAGNPNAVDNISDITAAGTYAVQGTIVAKSQRGFIVGDGTGYVYYYNQNYTQADYNIGDIVKLSGSVVVYGGVYEFNNSTTVTAATSSNYATENPTVISGADMDARVASTTPAQLSNYVQYEGTLTVSDTHYNITDITGATTAIGSISYPLDASEITALNGKHVTVKGYYVGISTGTYYNTMLGSIEETVNVNPTITAEDVEIAYNITSGSIAFTVNNPANDGVLSASTESEWLTLGTVGSTVPFTCEANNTASPRTATVTLTYTYDTDQFITKSVTVTQAGNPNTIDNISDITAAGTYTVQGTIVAMSQRGLIVGDGTGYVYYYVGQNFSTYYGIGDMIKLSGAVKVYGSVFEFDDTATVTEASDSNYEEEDPTVLTGADMDARVTSNAPMLSNYVQYEGTLSVSGTHYNITDIAGATTAIGSISYPVDTDEITALNGKFVKVTGYYVGISSSTYYNTMLESIEEVIVPIEGYTLTVSNLTNVNTYVFAGDETAAALEGEGSIQVNNGTTVIVSVDLEDGYVLESLMVDGTDVTDQLDETNAYTFIMPTHDVTITATAVVFVPATYTLATTIESGKSYIIVGKKTVDGEDMYYAMGEQRNTNRGGVAINVENNTVTLESNAVKELVITALEQDGFYSIFDADYPGYLYAASSGANQLKTKEVLDADGQWKITFDIANDTVGIVASNSTNRNVMQFNYNNGSPLFNCYSKASQSPIYLFVKEEASEAQTIELAAGWNWVSFNKEITMADLQAAIVAANPGAQPVIKSQTAGQTSYNGAIWLGALRNLDLTQMYEIKVANACTITLNGGAINPADLEITIKPGINWIAYPLNTTMSVATAFNGFSTTLDVVKSRNDGQANFMGAMWTGALKTLNPGEGYIYNSKATGNKTLTFPTR